MAVLTTVLVFASTSSQLVLADSTCAASVSTIDCQAIVNNWTEWIPLTGCAGGPLSGTDNAMKIMNYFIGNGFTQEQAAGIVGNTTVESGNDPLKLQHGAIPNVSDINYQQIPANILNSQNGWGVVQFTPPSKIGAYAQSVSQNPDNLSTQLDYVLKTLNTPNANGTTAAADIKTAKTPEEAATKFMNDYERPDPNQANLQARITDANEALKEYIQNGGTGGGTGGSCDTGTAAQCATPANESEGYDKIKSDLAVNFNLRLAGPSDAKFAAETYNTACALKAAPQYWNRLIGQGPIGVILESSTRTTDCTGQASGDPGAFVEVSGDCDKYFNRYLLGHELGHIFAFRNQSVFNDFKNNIYPKYPKLPDWDCVYHFGQGSIPEECFPAMIGQYLVWNVTCTNIPPTGYTCPGPTRSDYPTTYSGYYNFARDKLFGGIEYKTF